MKLFTFEHATPTLNNVVEKSKQHFGKYSSEKKKYTDAVALLARQSKVVIASRVYIVFVWHRKTARTDPDNVRHGAKYILDGMVKAKMLANDGAKQVAGFLDLYEYGHCDKVEVYAFRELAEVFAHFK